MKFNQKQNVIAENTAKTAAETAAETVVNNVAKTVAETGISPEQQQIIDQINKDALNADKDLITLMRSIMNSQVVEAMKKKKLVFKIEANPSSNGKTYANIRVYDVLKDKDMTEKTSVACIKFAEVEDGTVKHAFFGSKKFFCALEKVKDEVCKYIVMGRMDYFKIPKKEEEKDGFFEVVDYRK